jgi:enoyl-CoA hydratase
MTLPEYATLKLERKGEHVLLVTLNRPESLNAINTQMGRDTLALWTQLTAEPDIARCVVLTGSGDRAFCAGGDLKERNGMTDAAWRAQHEIFERGFFALLECPTPVIAAVNGHAFGGGLETALGCDFIYAAGGARFALSEVRLGIMPGGGGTQNLPRAVGERRAKELILTARAFTAEEGYEWGLVNRVCEPESLIAEALETAQAIADNAPLSVRQAKKSIHYGLQTDLLTGGRFEIEAYNRLVSTEDRHEGVRAFNEKRKPVFRGR